MPCGCGAKNTPSGRPTMVKTVSGPSQQFKHTAPDGKVTTGTEMQAKAAAIRSGGGSVDPS
jgi:hypothetical protein